VQESSSRPGEPLDAQQKKALAILMATLIVILSLSVQSAMRVGDERGNASFPFARNHVRFLADK